MSNESINAEEKQEPLSISFSAVPGASVKVISMADVPLLEVDWLWKPYIPFGKVTIIQGNPGEGKTTLALRLASACSRGKAFHEMEPHEPFNVIYQTAEDGLGDRLDEPDIGTAGLSRKERRDYRSPSAADQSNEAGERENHFFDKNHGERDSGEYEIDRETGWEPERNELFFSAECQDGNESFYEEALRDFDSGKLDGVITGAYLAADIQNLIDDDGEIIDCTTRHFGQRRKKDEMTMGGI